MAIVINPISPVAFSVFGIDIRWYALAYVIAFIIGFVLLRRFTSKQDAEIQLTKKQNDDLLTYLVLGVIIGGRLGYVLFYNLSYFINHPLNIFAVWQGGMSFHGGLIGVIVATLLFVSAQKYKNIISNSFKILDLLSVVAPIGLFLGRIANFINMEVMGRPTNSFLGVVFNGYSDYPRHPSPLYEAFLEGLVLFCIMFILYTKTNIRKHVGVLSGILCILYACFRIFCEQFRAPDIQIGFLTSWGLTMGQLLSSVMLVVGITIFIVAFRKK